MDKFEIKVLNAGDHYRICLLKSGITLKTTRTQYIADLIKEHGVFFLHDDFMRISPEEKAAIGEHHYKKIAFAKLQQTGQYLMRDKLKNANVTHRMARKNFMYEEEYFIVFSSNLEVNVTPLHYRLFACKPLLKNLVPTVQGELAI